MEAAKTFLLRMAKKSVYPAAIKCDVSRPLNNIQNQLC